MLNNIIHRSPFFSVQILIFFLLLQSSDGTSTIPVAALVDTNSPMGSMLALCMRMAVSDFYAKHPNYTTRLQLLTSNGDHNFAVADLLKHEVGLGIIGPQASTEEAFFVEIGQNVGVPIISLAPSSSAVSYSDNHYYVRTTPHDAVQARAVAAICKGFGWSEFVLLYEDTDYGSQFASLVNKASHDVDIALAYMVSIHNSADDKHILKQLTKLATKQTRVFLVHMNPSLGSRLFRLAKKADVMSEGYAWIITMSVSIFMNSMDSSTRDSMEGVLGIRPYLSPSKELTSFQESWKRNATLSSSAGSVMELNAYGLWAYDAVTALAIAVEKTNTAFGPQLLDELSSTRFRGLSGEFELVDGELKPSALEIFNVIGSGERTVGFWTPEKGIIRDFSSGSTNYDQLMRSIVLWPGESFTRPKGWAIPTTVNLRVGIPGKRGYEDFVEFAKAIFCASLKKLPFNISPDFITYNDTGNVNWSYDGMLHHIPKKFDMVVGDTTIWAPRAEYVDFSLPYSESGAVLVIKNKKPFDMWSFIKPLSWDLWLAIIVACMVMGFVLLVLERRVAVYWAPVTVLAFPERNMVSNIWSFVVLVFWLFMAFILMQSYTANLAAFLTVDQLKFALSHNDYVGYQDGSCMKELLTEKLHISASRLRNYTSPDEYHKAMKLGGKNGGIDAIFDQIPYMKIFLKKYDSQYKMFGPTYQTGGFGFAFPKRSPLVSYFSKAILDVTQGPNMTAIEQTYLGHAYTSKISQGTSSLSFQEFAGLFLVLGSVTVLALFFSETPLGQTLSHSTTQFLHNCINYKSSRLHPVEEDSGAVGESSEGGGEDVQKNVITSPEIEMHEIDETPAAQHSDEAIHTDANGQTNLPE